MARVTQRVSARRADTMAFWLAQRAPSWAAWENGTNGTDETNERDSGASQRAPAGRSDMPVGWRCGASHADGGVWVHLK